MYGRSITEEPEESEGAAICKVEEGPGRTAAYAVITYRFVHESCASISLS